MGDEPRYTATMARSTSKAAKKDGTAGSTGTGEEGQTKGRASKVLLDDVAGMLAFAQSAARTESAQGQAKLDKAKARDASKAAKASQQKQKQEDKDKDGKVLAKKQRSSSSSNLQKAKQQVQAAELQKKLDKKKRQRGSTNGDATRQGVTRKAVSFA